MFSRSDPGKRLRMLMAEKDINVNELADMTGIHPDTITRLRTGRGSKPSMKTAKRIAKALGVQINNIWPWINY
jgi:DNA-binding Xre family transcriptional regulator